MRVPGTGELKYYQQCAMLHSWRQVILVKGQICGQKLISESDEVPGL